MPPRRSLAAPPSGASRAVPAVAGAVALVFVVGGSWWRSAEERDAAAREQEAALARASEANAVQRGEISIGLKVLKFVREGGGGGSLPEPAKRTARVLIVDREAHVLGAVPPEARRQPEAAETIVIVDRREVSIDEYVAKDPWVRSNEELFGRKKRVVAYVELTHLTFVDAPTMKAFAHHEIRGGDPPTEVRSDEGTRIVGSSVPLDAIVGYVAKLPTR